MHAPQKKERERGFTKRTTRGEDVREKHLSTKVYVNKRLIQINFFYFTQSAYLRRFITLLISKTLHVHRFKINRV